MQVRILRSLTDKTAERPLTEHVIEDIIELILYANRILFAALIWGGRRAYEG